MEYDISKSEELKKELQNKVLDLAESFKQNPQDIAEYLKFTSRFYNYSSRNTMLIYMQNMGAMYCNSFKGFKDMGYSVKRGEHGMKILVPTIKTYLHTDNGLIPLSKATAEQKQAYKLNKIEAEQKLYFKVGTVFDITQTNCPKEDYPKFLDIGYSSEQHAKIYNTLKKFCEEKLNCPVHENAFESVALRGYYAPKGLPQKFVVRFCFPAKGLPANFVVRFCFPVPPWDRKTKSRTCRTELLRLLRRSTARFLLLC